MVVGREVYTSMHQSGGEGTAGNSITKNCDVTTTVVLFQLLVRSTTFGQPLFSHVRPSDSLGVSGWLGGTTTGMPLHAVTNTWAVGWWAPHASRHIQQGKPNHRGAPANPNSQLSACGI